MGKGKKFIVLGDKTTHGGTVVGAWGQCGPTPMTINGKAVACVGDPCTCPKKGHSICYIVQGAESPRSTLNGKQIAREGDKTSCGASLISAGQSLAEHIPDGDGASVAEKIAARRAIAEAEKAAARVAGAPIVSATAEVSEEKATDDFCLQCWLKGASQRKSLMPE